jgi:predicted solute-binding protein
MYKKILCKKQIVNHISNTIKQFESIFIVRHCPAIVSTLVLHLVHFSCSVFAQLHAPFYIIPFLAYMGEPIFWLKETTINPRSELFILWHASNTHMALLALYLHQYCYCTKVTKCIKSFVLCGNVNGGYLIFHNWALAMSEHLEKQNDPILIWAFFSLNFPYYLLKKYSMIPNQYHTNIIDLKNKIKHNNFYAMLQPWPWTLLESRLLWLPLA